MKSFLMVIAAAVLGVTGHCRADDQAAGIPLKAVLYEEDQSHPNGFQFVGSVVWHIDIVASPSPEPVVRADVEIPDRRMGVRLLLRRNINAALPASHTVEIAFTLPLDFPHGGIANVPGLLLKAGETTSGIPLRGVSVKVADNFFLVGLSNVEADAQHNVQLMKERRWFDVPIVYSDSRRAILAIDRGKLDDLATAVPEPPAPKPATKIPTVPINHPPGEVTLKPWPIAPADRVPLDAVLSYTASAKPCSR